MGTGIGVGLLGGLELVVAAGAGLIVFFWSNHAPYWRDETSVSGWGFDNENEWKWWHKTLNQDQRDYLTMLSKVRREKRDTTADGDTDPLVMPSGVLEAAAGRERQKKGECLSLPVPRRGGNARHDAYALKVTRSPHDYFVMTPTRLFINYDGLSDGRLVWEVKTGHGWMFDPGSRVLALRKVAEWDAQRQRGLDVAAACGYQHVWSVTDRWIRESLLVRWGGNPFVFNIPE